jgi:glycosyltransferase involved in cell wall biosynthesis
VVAVSDTVRQACVEREGLPAERIVTIVNGIDTRKYAPLAAARRERKRSELGIGAADVLLLFVGRFSEQKAPDAFVRLVWRLRETGHPVRGVMCGDGPLGEQIRSLLAAGPPGVAWLGFRDDVPELLGAADLFVSTSRNEGLPLNVMEAMATATPVIGPALPQISGLFATRSDLATDLLPVPPTRGEVPTATVAAWAQRVGRLLDAPASLVERGAAGRRIITEEYSLERMVSRHDALYRRLLDRERRLE